MEKIYPDPQQSPKYSVADLQHIRISVPDPILLIMDPNPQINNRELRIRILHLTRASEEKK